jgi:hypothetical protein
VRFEKHKSEKKKESTPNSRPQINLAAALEKQGIQVPVKKESAIS